MTEDQKQRQGLQLWKIANEFRGKMGADEFRNDGAHKSQGAKDDY